MDTTLHILQTTGIVLLYCLLYVIMLASVLIIPLGIPGQFAIVVAALAVTLIAGTETISLWVVALLLGMAILAEVIEALAGFLGASKAKGSIWSSFGALGGGIIGAIIGSLILPIIGSLIGALLGTFCGAYAVEYYRTRAIKGATHVAKGALIGRIVGSIVKVFFALAMIVIVTLALL
jgi:hypothetical protein